MIIEDIHDEGDGWSCWVTLTPEDIHAQVLALDCPTCEAAAGQWCSHPTNSAFIGLHGARRVLANHTEGETA